MRQWKFAFRSLVRRPGFALAVCGLLTLGIGVNTALFSVVDRFLKSGKPLDLAVIDADAEGIHPEEIVRELHEISPNIRMLFLMDEDDASSVCSTPTLGHVREVLRKPFRGSQLLGKALEIMDRPSVLTA